MYTINIIPRILHFKQPAGTSRGTYTTRKVWYIYLSTTEYPERVGVGECAPLLKLSCDDLPDYEQILCNACRCLEQTGELDTERFRAGRQGDRLDCDAGERGTPKRNRMAKQQYGK